MISQANPDLPREKTKTVDFFMYVKLLLGPIGLEIDVRFIYINMAVIQFIVHAHKTPLTLTSIAS